MADKKYFQPQTTAQAIQDFYGGKNLIEINNHSNTINGVTFIVNHDAGTITCNGTATARAEFIINIGKNIDPDHGPYILSGCPSNGGRETYSLNLQVMRDPWNAYRDFGEGVTISDTIIYSVETYITIEAGMTVSNLVFKPMLRFAEGTSDKFEPYSPSTRRLNDFIQNTPGTSTERDITSKLNSGIFYPQISFGIFDDIKPGDIIVGPTTKVAYWIAHRDLFYGYDDIGLKSIHHVIIMPTSLLANGQMNETNTTSGGYIVSKGKETVDQLIQDYFVKDFGDHIKKFKNLQVNATGSDGVPTGWQWYETYGDLMSECNVYGAPVWSNSPYNTGIQKEQFEIFRDLGTHILGATNNWLKDICSPTYFALANHYGYASYYSASLSTGLRPFAVLAA